MINLSVLGKNADESSLMLCDEEGNRYLLPINDELRAYLRTDMRETPSAQPHSATPREIQSLVRSGKSVEEVCSLTLMPASYVMSLARPILQERFYVKNQALNMTITREAGSMTIEEIVSARLIGRGLSPQDISWEVRREEKSPWILYARYEYDGISHEAMWSLDLRRKTLTALNEEATWLSETPVRSHVIPTADSESAADTAARKHQSSSPIASLLDKLNSERGKPAPEPSVENDVFIDPYMTGAHPALSEPSQAQDATILTFPSQSGASRAENNNYDGSDRDSFQSENSASASTFEKERVASLSPVPEEPVRAPHPDASAGDEATSGQLPLRLAPHSDVPDSTPAEKSEKKKKNSRPTMPSWDEIVYGPKA